MDVFFLHQNHSTQIACDGTSKVLMDDDEAQSLDKLLSSHLGRSKKIGKMYIVRTSL